jgi:hypothetical protein
MTDTNQLAYETVTFFEVWLLREFSLRATSDDCLRVRNAAEDLITDDPEYWSNNSCTRLYETACQAIGLKPYCH